MEEATEVDTFASGGQLPQLPDFVKDIVDKQATRKQEETVSVAELNSMAVAAMDKAKKDRQDKIAAANATARASKRAVAKTAAADKRAADMAAARAVAASAAQAETARAKARALIDRADSSDHSPYSEAQINAAREVLSQVDSFASGNPFEARQNAGPAAGYGGYRGDPVGRESAIGSRGGGGGRAGGRGR